MMNELVWSKWQPFNEWTDNSHVPAAHGVYQVRACETKGVPVAVSRSCGVDANGFVVYRRRKNQRPVR